MAPVFKKYGQVIFAVIGALATIGSALWFKDTEYENTWLYVFTVWLLLYSVLEVYLRKKNKEE